MLLHCLGKCVEFNVWRCINEATLPDTSKDLLLGTAQISTDPLFAGMRQILGWYHVTSFGQSDWLLSDSSQSNIGQIKVGLMPSSLISPSRSTKHFSRMPPTTNRLLEGKRFVWFLGIRVEINGLFRTFTGFVSENCT